MAPSIPHPVASVAEPRQSTGCSSQSAAAIPRRAALQRMSAAVGATALAALSARELDAATHFAPKAKRVVMLFQSGGPSQIDLFDPKPGLAKLQGVDLPDSIRMGQRLTGMTASQDRFPIAASKFAFRQHGASEAWISELLPWTAQVADELCFVRTMWTEAINHDPAVTFCQTGAQLAGRPSMGAWLSYGLGSMNDNLPTFVAMISGTGDQPLYDRLWGSGFLPSRHQGVKLRSSGDAVSYLSNPAGVDVATRRQTIEDANSLNRLHLEEVGDPEIATRIAQYELAFRMQASVPELTDISTEPESTFALYGEDARQRGTFAQNCLLARRLLESGVRFVQLFHRGWDQHRHLPTDIAKMCRATDQASAALVLDLKRRGLLDDTVVVWGGEFGRTVYCQGAFTAEDYGRDHHPRCFTIWLTGGGVRGGQTIGQTDDFSYNIVEKPVSIHDLHATLLHLLGLDHQRLTYKFQGRDYRLTDVHGQIVRDLLA